MIYCKMIEKRSKMKAGIVYFTDRGFKTANKIKIALTNMGFVCQIRDKKEPLKEWTKVAFKECEAIVFVSATGIAVRTIGPFLKSKTEDPAVLVADDSGKFVISLVSGHIGGANEIADYVAKTIEATPVITTSTDVNSKFAVDTWAKKNGLLIENIKDVKAISMALVNGGDVGIAGDMKLNIENENLKEKNLPLGINISWHNRKVFGRELKLVPPWLTLGIGCKKNTPVEKIQSLVDQVLKDYDICKDAICKVASIDLKKEEQGLIEFCNANGWEFETYTAEQLKSVQGEFSHSSFVEQVTGVDNVCQRAAVLGATVGDVAGKTVVEKTSKDGVTVAIAVKEASLNVK